MANIENNLRGEARLEFLSESGFWDKSLYVKFFLFLLFTLMTFFSLHYRDVKMEHYDLGSEAKKYVFSQVPFEFLDKEGTMFAKREALRDIGSIYVIDEKLIDRRVRDIKRALSTELYRFMNSESESPYESGAGNITYSDVLTAVNLIVDSCHNTLLTDAKTFLKLQRHGFDIDAMYPLEGVSEHESLYIPQKIWENIFEAAFQGRQVPFEAQALARQFFVDETWSFQVDISQERTIRDQILAQVPDKYVKVKAGQRIIDQGEKVTERHQRMFRSLKEALKKQTRRDDPIRVLSSLTVSAGLIAILSLVFFIYYPNIYASNRQILILITIYGITLGFTELIERLVLDSSFSHLSLVDTALFVPLSTLLCVSLFPVGASLLLSLLVLVVLTFSLPVNSENFALLNFFGILMALSSRHQLQHRRYIFMTCTKIWLSCSILFCALRFLQSIEIELFLWQDLLFLFFSITAAGVLAIVLLPVLENLFQVMTEMTLMDYLDPNKELLRRLSLEAPGTYQHSLLVAHLAEGAASAIGARSLFCRVSALYHDIGKLAFPHYFAENQQGVNVHQLLTPLESAQVIIAHISEGIAIARKHGLPEPFVDIIKEHHGTSIVHYFYEKAKQQEDGDFEEKDFRYCGPKPRSKEAVIVMLADCLEAASRSLSVVNEESLTDLIENTVKNKIKDNQLDHSNLSLKELAVVKQNLVKTLLAASHTRVKYPGAISSAATEAAKAIPNT